MQMLTSNRKLKLISFYDRLVDLYALAEVIYFTINI